ncbi:rRNA pseudouridine synthase [bacterium]|nr:rRNA pseudouridine synthase [bacterium]
MPLERLQKVIANRGKHSRRQAEDLIKAGKVIVDGKKVTTMGVKIDSAHAEIVVLGKKLPPLESYIYLFFHKPRECMVTRSDPEGRKTIYDYLPKKYHKLKPVGRLDFESEGLLLLTNDGELSLKLTHPRYEGRKTYHVKVEGRPSEKQLDRLRKGVVIDDSKTQPVPTTIVEENPKSTWLEMVLSEGRNRQIRKMCEKVFLNVKTLVRVKMGPFKLTGIPYGKYKEEDADFMAHQIQKWEKENAR